ncbi:DUF1176 domain-containing protein [Roseomonas elaeocarpi]|uniref:DUF1176 domain-containing protein n=1 Tax=Roseomonas elaeocarpi TaxID=907779 RepID=A0ABV6JSP6_9PROT
MRPNIKGAIRPWQGEGHAPGLALPCCHDAAKRNTVSTAAEDHPTMRRLLLLATILFLPAAAPPPAVPVYRQFGHWFVACDNTRACVARGFDEATSAQLDLIRPAGDAPPTLTLAAEDPVDPAALRLDGKPFPLPAPAWTSKDGAVSTSDPAAVDAFVAAARNAQSIALDAAPSGDDAPRTVPLDGFTAAVLLVDAVQGRPGTATALIAPRGTAAVPAAPPVPAAPAWTPPPPLTRAETASLLRQARSLRSVAFESCDVRDPPEVFALDATRALAIRPCYMAAYQGSSVVAVLPRGGGSPVPVKLALPGLPEDATEGPDMVDPEFDPASGTLTTVSKGRGLADCGSSESWVWSRGAFRLTALSYQNQCGGAAPGDWPTLFRTR